MPADPTQLYSPGDFTAVRNRIFQDSLDAVRKRFPVENDRYILSLENVDYDSPREFSIKDQKKAVQNDQSLTWKIKGNWVLTDKGTGKVVSRSSRRSIMDVPYLTQRGTFIRSGTETTLPTQMRLVPGVYSRVGEDGLAKAHINARPGTGNTVMMTLNPAKPVFRVSVGTRNYDLFPLLKHLGVTDDEIKSAWGKEIYKINEDAFVNGGGWYKAKTAAEVDPNDPWEKASKDVLGGELDTNNTEATFGKPYNKVDKDLLLAASARLIGLARGESQADNRDSMENQRFFGPADYIAERIRLDAGGLARNLLWRVSRYGDTEKIPSSPLTKYVHGLFTESNLAQAIEETNLLDAYKRATMVTRMGEGGIGSIESAPMSARLVHNTYKGFIDPVASPECASVNHLVLTSNGWKNISKVTTEDFVACLIYGVVVYRNPEQVVSYDFEGELYSYTGDGVKYELTGNHRMWVRDNSSKEYRFEFAENINGKEFLMDLSSKGDKSSEITLTTFNYSMTPYKGKVYCLTVPGGLFYTRIEGYKPFWTGNSLRVGLDTQIAHSARRGPDGLAYAPVIDVQTGQRIYLSSLESSKVPVGFPEALQSRDKLIPAMVGNNIEYLPKNQVRYFVPNGDALFSTAADFVPIKSGIKAGRLLMAQKHQTQAMSVKDRMAPYVQSLDPDGSGKSVEEVYSGILGAVKADKPGKVVKVTKDDITVLQPDGTKHSYGLYDNYPLNRKSVVSNTPRVKVGDVVQPGQLLASSSYTDDNGIAALGTQLRSAWLSYKGWNYLDAIVVSESAAKKLTSEHFYHEGVDREDGVNIGRDRFIAAFPSKFNREQLGTIDPTGAVKPGTIVHKGDPLVLAMSLRPGGPGTGYRALHKDVSSVWEHEFPGEVTDVVDGKDGMRVYVKSWVPLQVGDKLATRFANKGTCAAVIPDEKMPRDAEGRPLEVLFSPTGIVSRCYDEQHEFLTKRGWQKGRDIEPDDELWIYDPYTDTCRWGRQLEPMHISEYRGEMFGFINEQVDFLLTTGHRVWTRGEEPWSAWRERTVDDIYGKRCVIPCVANRSDNPEATPFILPPVEPPPRANKAMIEEYTGVKMFNAFDWAELLGWYLAEGNTDWRAKDNKYAVHIAQSIKAKPDNVEKIRKLLISLGIRFSYSDKNYQFHISSKRLAAYFKQFGYCYEKFIPDWLFTQPVEVMRRFLIGMWGGDGRIQPVVHDSGTLSHTVGIGLTSEKLIDQLQIVLTMCGYMSSRSKTIKDKRTTYNYKDIYRLGVSTVERKYRVLRTMANQNIGWYKTPYEGLVYCPTVETGFVLTRRNGKLACLGNTNSAALIEAALGKAAEKTGKRYILPGFGTNLVAFAQKELADAGLSDREDITDPDTGKIIKGIFTGNSYVTKFHHTSESKGGARSTGAYTSDEQPASGGHDGAKTLGGLVLGAFAGHGASEVLKDMKLIKGQKNTEFWRDFKMGKTPRTPGVPLIYQRFLASLEGSGIHVTRNGDATNVFAMTNSDVDTIARAELNSAATYDDKRFLPIRGGLFDPNIFGPNGDQWAKIKLDEPILNPIMDDVVCNFLNLKKAELDDVLAGRKQLPNGMTGGEGLKKQLASLNLDRMIENAKNTIRTGPPSKRDKAVKTLRWAMGMKAHEATPDMFMLDSVPVLPPRYRRITKSGNLNMIADANYLYKQLLDARDDLRQAKEAGLPDELLGYGRKRIVDSYRAITGLAEPQDKKLVDSDVAGLLKWVFGKGSPKMGAGQRLVIGGKLDVAGRSVINVDPRLSLDEIGMPEKQAWNLYKDFVIRKLVQGGMNPLQATKSATEHTPSAKQALLQVMSERPVIATRAPALHKFSVLAFKPKLVSGDVLKLNSVSEKSLNADFDGDAQHCFVQVRIPSKMLNKILKNK